MDIKIFVYFEAIDEIGGLGCLNNKNISYILVP